MGRRPLAESRNISLESRYKQRLAEPPRAAQEDVVAEVCHVPDILSLVDIKHIVLSDFLKGLYAHGQSLQLLFFHISKMLCITIIMHTVCKDTK